MTEELVTIRVQVLENLLELFNQADCCPSSEISSPTNTAGLIAQRDFWLSKRIISFEIWSLSTRVISAQDLRAQGIITPDEFDLFMESLGFEIDGNVRKPGPDLTLYLDSIF